MPRGSVYSLRLRLIGAVLGASVILWLVGLGVFVSIAWKETSEVFDDGLKEGGRLILGGSAGLFQQQTMPAEPSVAADHARVKAYYQVVAHGSVVRRTERAPAQPFIADFKKNKGFANVFVDGAAWRVYVLRASDNRFEVQVAQPLADRLKILSEIVEHLIWPTLGLLVLLSVVVWLLIGRLVRPIEHTARSIQGKSPDDLAPVEASRLSELRPIVTALNQVFARLATALQAERRFTADAAHELRTPLAALRMKTQLLQRQYPDQQMSMQALRSDIDRCTGLVENLLILARVDHADRLPQDVVVLDELLGALSATTAAQASTRSIELTCGSDVATLHGNAELLAIALRNIVDNAIRYCPAGSRVDVRITRSATGVRIAVRDDGPGILPAQRHKLVERFYRALGTGESGSGLGLSIVDRVVALHAGTLSFEQGLAGRGLGVLIDLPAA